MKFRFLKTLQLALALAVLAGGVARAEQHRATHLGNLSTRFAPTLLTPEDMRSRFADEKLRPDIAEILQQWGWTGKLADLFAAAATNEIIEVKIPVGDTMPFMSSREAGRPICLRNVLWAGREPISAYAFTFVSDDRRYRCVMPKPCSNFYVEDLGPVPKPILALDCSLPEKIPIGRPLNVCLTVHNVGNANEPNAVITLLIPPGATVTNLVDQGLLTGNHIVWEISRFAPDATRQFCATFVSPQAGPLNFTSSATGRSAQPVQSACETEVFGIAAILLEKADNPDPVSLGSNTTYTVKITNQGSGDDANVQVIVSIAPELVPVSASEGTIDGQNVTLPLVPKLAAKQSVSYQIIARGVKAGDGHTKFTLTTSMLKNSIMAEESTTVY